MDRDTETAYRMDSGVFSGAQQSNGATNGIAGSPASPPIQNGINGANGSSNTNTGQSTKPSSSSSPSSVSVDISMNTTPQSILDMMKEEGEKDDIPRPTANGGYTHTQASRAKIGMANKGKTPWNKGRQRSPQERARIAAGVNARNREKFLLKLKDMGLTEEEYVAHKREEKRKREAERRARRTPKGGTRPTEETKAKISRILKDKYARGEIKPRKVDPSRVRRGFTHTEETRTKIAESLRKRWANDPEYRQKMLEKNQSKPQSIKEQTKRKISESLKKKWEDPQFRSEMVAKMAENRQSVPNYGAAHREKISKAMKAKWQDKEYREKTLKAIAERQAKLKKERPVVAKKQPLKGDYSIRLVSPLQASETRPKKKKVARKKLKGSPIVVSSTVLSPGDRVAQVVRKVKKVKKVAKSVKKVAKKKKEPDGSVNRLREERRDLFDLLYGDDPQHSIEDDDDDDDYDEEDNVVLYDQEIDKEYVKPARSISSRFGLNDEDLDSFDPYGLDDY